MQITRLSPSAPLQRLRTTSGGGVATGTALTIGNFDGVHRGHQAMLALLAREASNRGLQSCAMTFEPHPRDFFATALGKPDLAPARIATLRDKLCALSANGVEHCVVLPFKLATAQLTAQQFIDQILVKALNVRFLLVGDDFRFGAKRQGDYQTLQESGKRWGFDVARMASYEAGGQRVSSSLVRACLQRGDLAETGRLLGRPYCVSGHIVHGRKLGRELGFRTLNLRFSHWNPACSGIFAVQVHGLGTTPLRGVANMGIRPSLDANDVNGGRVLLETYVLDWPADFGPDYGYGKIVRVDLLHKLHEERRYDSLQALMTGIEQDCLDARAYFAANHTETSRQTTRDRI
jgi:riboflavin kinase / FMN adenylyltransferase